MQEAIYRPFREEFMPTLKAAAATAEIAADSDMIIGGSILPFTCMDQEAPLRASALLLLADAPVCLVSCDVLALGRDLCDEAARRITASCGIPFENILLAATHTHHAPSTMTVHAYRRDEEFCRRTVEATVRAAEEAYRKLQEAEGKPNECEAELLFACGIEMTTGQNSRWLLPEGQIAWDGHDRAQMIRPTGPHDPALPLLALRHPGRIAGGLFVYASHNIGALRPGVRSPGLFGLAARELEVRHGGPFLFLPGAFGSSHRLDSAPPAEAISRLIEALEDAMARLEPALTGPVLCLKRPFSYTVRPWDEEAENEAVSRYCRKWFDAERAASTIRAFTGMRAAIQPHAGESRETWLQVMRLGEVAIVGIPGEMFASLGLEIRRRSPFRHTVVVGLANDEIGYIPDRKGYRDGGYQTWAGFHSLLEPGTGERMVEAALKMLEEAMRGPQPEEAVSDRLRSSDAEALQTFYNHLGSRARWLFRPLGWNVCYPDCLQLCRDAAEGRRLDIVLRAGDLIVGWGLLVNWQNPVPHLGVCVADDWCGKGYGRRLMEELIDAAREARKEAIELIHVKDNIPAGTLYRKLGFQETGEHIGPDGNDYWEMRLAL
ncbi:MAG: GNAT family N-acetyltransferase [Armatimonadetes bacterium]|nr:GNAT family N-acetyltransferase [Armatimonadota bacterium]